jgi:hypothetical protein
MTTQINAQPLSSILVPVNALCAALLCASKEETRYYLRGVYLHRSGDRLRLCATDGHRIFIMNHQPTDPETGNALEADQLPEWLWQAQEGRPQAGVILPSDGLKERLAVLKKAASVDGNAYVRISYGTEQPAIVLESVLGDIRFAMPPVDGTFPDYEALLRNFTSGVVVPKEDADPAKDAGPLGEFEPIGYNGAYLKDLAAVATQLGASSLSFFGKSKSDPTLITFPGAPGAVVYLMPMRVDEVVAAETVAIIAPSIAATRAALQAHVTRNLKWAKKAKTPAERGHYEARADEFKRRMDAVIAATSAALPKPEPKAEAKEEPKTTGEVVPFPQKQEQPQPLTITDAVIDEKPAPAAKQDVPAVVAKPRRSAKLDAPKKAKAKSQPKARKRA